MKSVYNTTEVRNFIVQHFDDEELTQLCDDYFKDVSDQFTTAMSKSSKAQYLIQWLVRREQLGKLVELLKTKRDGPFAEWDAKLKSPADPSSLLEEVSAGGTPEFAEVFIAPSTRVSSRPDGDAEAAAGEHPLAGDPSEVKRWFLEDLSREEQVFVVTAALFSRIEQHELMAVYQDLLKAFEPAPNTDGKEERSQQEDKVRIGPERTIRLDISLGDLSAREQPPAPASAEPLFVDEVRLLELANLEVVDGERNTEHGPTIVRLVDFKSEERRLKIIRLLASSFPQMAQKLAPYLRRLGGNPHAALRKRTAEAVGELMHEVDFIRFKEAVVNPWATSGNPYMSSAAGFALAEAAGDERYRENVKLLIKHWVSSPNRSLNWTGVGSCVPLGSLWPEHTMDVLARALEREWPELHLLVVVVVRQLCESSHHSLVLERLQEWASRGKQDRELQRSALFVFLGAIEVIHIINDEVAIDRTAQLYLLALAGLPATNRRPFRTAALAKLKRWTEESFKDPAKGVAIEQLFTRLRESSRTGRDRERILFYLQRWGREEERFKTIAESW